MSDLPNGFVELGPMTVFGPITVEDRQREKEKLGFKFFFRRCNDFIVAEFLDTPADPNGLNDDLRGAQVTAHYTELRDIVAALNTIAGIGQFKVYNNMIQLAADNQNDIDTLIMKFNSKDTDAILRERVK